MDYKDTLIKLREELISNKSRVHNQIDAHFVIYLGYVLPMERLRHYISVKDYKRAWDKVQELNTELGDLYEKRIYHNIIDALSEI